MEEISRIVVNLSFHGDVIDAVFVGGYGYLLGKTLPSNPSFRGVVAYLCFGGIASGKIKKPETRL